MLRELLSSLLDPESPPVPGSREAALHNDDGTLLRYIQGRPTLEDAAQMFREAMKWREVRKGGGRWELADVNAREKRAHAYTLTWWKPAPSGFEK